MMTNGHVGFFQAQALHGIFARNKKEIQEIEKSHNAFTNLQDKSSGQIFGHYFIHHLNL